MLNLRIFIVCVFMQLAVMAFAQTSKQFTCREPMLLIRSIGSFFVPMGATVANNQPLLYHRTGSCKVLAPIISGTIGKNRIPSWEKRKAFTGTVSTSRKSGRAKRLFRDQFFLSRGRMYSCSVVYAGALPGMEKPHKECKLWNMG